MTIRAGLLRHRVTIQQGAEGTADAHGVPAITWTDVATVWARIEPVSGLEQVRGMKLQAETTHLVTMRYRTSCTHDMRLKWTRDGTTRYLYFAGPPVNVDERNRELLVQCREEA